MASIRTPILWIGGKARMVEKLLPLMPEHQVYVEPFGGSGALLFGKPPVHVEVYNDLHSGLVNLYRVLANPEQYEAFVRRANTCLYSRELFEEFRSGWEGVEDPVERAFQWWYVARSSFGGKWGQGWHSTKCARTFALHSHWNVIEHLDGFHRRLKNVFIEHQDWKRVVERYDSVETLHYLDPPYIPTECRRKYLYRYSLTLEQHHELVEVCVSLKGKVMVSGYDHPCYSALEENGFERYEFPTSCVTTSEPRVEIVWIKD